MSKKPTTTALAKWDERLAEFAKAAVEAEKGTGGNFIGLKGGVMTYDGVPIEGNKMAAVVLHSILENVYFSEAYDPDVAASPKCYAFGLDETKMAPHPLVVERGDAQHATCAGCKHNAFGSADVGKGKACRNTRRVALIPAGTYAKDKLTMFKKPDEFRSAIAHMKLPVTSVKDYSAFVKQIAGTLKRPPFAIFTNIQAVPDPKNQFKVVFTPMEQVPDELMPIMIQRHEEAKAAIDFPYPAFSESESKTKPSAKGKKGRKY